MKDSIRAAATATSRPASIHQAGNRRTSAHPTSFKIHIEFPRRLFRAAWFQVMAMVVAGCLVPRHGLAHGDLHEQIKAVTEKIQQHPTAELFLKRGELERAHENYDAALADYTRAAQLDPSLEAVFLCRGLALSQAGRLLPAKEALDQFLLKKPGHAEGHVARARMLARLKELAAATADYDRAIELASEPRPECFLERARVLMDLGDLKRALAGLESGLQQLGTLPTLQTLAMEIEIQGKHYEAALARLNTLIAQAERKETWLARRGEILAQAGRPAEARRVYADALAAIEQLPARLQHSQATQQLATRLRAATDPAARTQANTQTPNL